MSGEGFAVDASVIKADANRGRKTTGEKPVDLRDPQHATRAVREYLAALDVQGEPATPPAAISPTDPAARWTAAPGGPAFYAYSTNYLVDVDAGIIVDVEATPALRTDEVNATRTMVERVQQRFDLKPSRLIGDMAYGAAELLGWMVDEKVIEPHVPVWDKTQRNDETLSSSEFEWDEATNEYRCPQGRALRSQWRTFKSARTHVTKADTVIYRSTQADCTNCRSKTAAVPTRQFEKSPAAFTNPREMSRATLRRPLRTGSPAKIERRLRCCLRISNASSGWIACGYADAAAPTTNSCSQRLRKICDEWRSGLDLQHPKRFQCPRKAKSPPNPLLRQLS